MTKEEFHKIMEENAAIVETWPVWKQNIIRDSLSPTVPVAREPVDNFRIHREREERNLTK